MAEKKVKLGDTVRVGLSKIAKAEQSASPPPERRYGLPPFVDEERRPRARNFPGLIFYHDQGRLYSIKNPFSPSLVTSPYPIVGTSNIRAQEIGSSKTLFYFNFETFRVWNVKKPKSPVLLGSLLTTGEGSIYDDADRVYSIRLNFDDFQILSIADKSAPSLLATVPVHAGAFSVNQRDPSAAAASGDFLYISNVDQTQAVPSLREAAFLCTYNVSNPGAVTQTNAITLQAAGLAYGGGGLVLQIYSEHLYSTFLNDLRVYSLASPSAPSLVNTLSDFSASGARSSALADGRLYLAVDDGGIYKLLIYDLTTPTSPSLLHSFTLAGLVQSVVVTDGFAYAVIFASGFKGIQIIDVTGVPVEAALIEDGLSPISGIWAQAK